MGIGDQSNAKAAYEIALESLAPGSFAYDFTKMKFEEINHASGDQDSQS